MELKRLQCGLIEVKRGGGEPGTFSGYGAVFGNVDHHGDALRPGAFVKSLAAWQAKGKYPKMLLQHGGWGINAEDMLPLGQWTSMKEDNYGLKVEGRLFAMDTERAKMVYAGLTSGELDSLSIGYVPKVWESADGKDGRPDRYLTEVDLWEVSPVTFPANELATINDVKNATPSMLREIESYIREAGCSRADAIKAVAGIKKWARRDAAPSSPDELRDEAGPEEAAALAAAKDLAAKLAVGSLRF